MQSNLWLKAIHRFSNTQGRVEMNYKLSWENFWVMEISDLLTMVVVKILPHIMYI